MSLQLESDKVASRKSTSEATLGEIDVNFRLKTILSLHAEIANYGRSIAEVTINRTLEHENPIFKIEQIPLTGL